MANVGEENALGTTGGFRGHQSTHQFDGARVHHFLKVLLVVHQAPFQAAAHHCMTHGTAQRIVIELAFDQVILGARFQCRGGQRIAVMPGENDDGHIG